jgi:hypothetical protein
VVENLPWAVRPGPYFSHSRSARRSRQDSSQQGAALPSQQLGTGVSSGRGGVGAEQQPFPQPGVACLGSQQSSSSVGLLRAAPASPSWSGFLSAIGFGLLQQLSRSSCIGAAAELDCRGGVEAGFPQQQEPQAMIDDCVTSVRLLNR